MKGYHLAQRVFKDQDWSWRHQARCKGQMGLFFVDRNPETKQMVTTPTERKAKTLCVSCPVRVQCLTAAVKNGEEYGIWGGCLPWERRHIIGYVSRGRPNYVYRTDIDQMLEEMDAQAEKLGLTTAKEVVG